MTPTARVAAPREIAIVLDDGFGARLLELAREMPVYAVSSPENMAAIDRSWDELSDREGFQFAFGATGFRANSPQLTDVVAEQLEFIESVHGAESGERPFSELRILGMHISPSLEGLLSEYGFLDVSEEECVIVARR